MRECGSGRLGMDSIEELLYEDVDEYAQAGEDDQAQENAAEQGGDGAQGGLNEDVGGEQPDAGLQHGASAGPSVLAFV